MAPLNGCVLIVDGDSALRRRLRTKLGGLGFDIGEATTGEEALRRLRMVDYEAVLLDINMPGIGGVETCRQIRRMFPRLPILVLTVRDTVDHKVEALDAGADDCITKPFQMRELTARIRSAVRRFRTPALTSEALIVIGDITLDPTRRRVVRSGSEVRLTPHEFDALQLLMEHAGRPIPYAQLTAALWGPDSGENRKYVRVLIGQLRKKCEVNRASPEYILTDICFGYHFREA